MIGRLKEILDQADREERAAAAFNVFGYEDAKAVALAAQSCGRPVILMANRAAVDHMGVRLMGLIMQEAARSVSVPVGIHLDHATDYDCILEAIREGYTSVMFDGSQLPCEENVRMTRQVVKAAHAGGVSVEGEIGSVGYQEPDVRASARYTEPEEAKAFYEATQVDALAVAVGTVHRMRQQEAVLQFDRLEAIHQAADVPLVIHGSTGVSDKDLGNLVRHGARKINIGTALRMAFGQSLRSQLEADPRLFDRIIMFRGCMEAVQREAEEKIRLIG